MRNVTYLAALLAAGSIAAYASTGALAAGASGSSASGSPAGQTTGQSGSSAQQTQDLQPGGDMLQQGQTGDQAAAGGMNPQQLGEQEVRQIQQALQDAGHNIQVDGLWGPNTESALRQFQQAKGLDATGQLDDDTTAALEVDLEEQGAAGTAGGTGAQPSLSPDSGSGAGQDMGGQGMGGSQPQQR